VNWALSIMALLVTDRLAELAAVATSTAPDPQLAERPRHSLVERVGWVLVEAGLQLAVSVPRRRALRHRRLSHGKSSPPLGSPAGGL